jgi:hypothetical protein
MTMDEVCVGSDYAVKWKNKQMLKENGNRFGGWKRSPNKIYYAFARYVMDKGGK